MKLKKLFVTLFAFIVSVSVITSCRKNDDPGSQSIDYVHTSNVRLKLDYKKDDGSSRDFFTDGIALVKLQTAIDGDTAHFKTADNKLIKSRFYGVDTPESTGAVENWGATASKFTKEKLKSSKTIVVTSTSLNEYKAPETDSTGTRYLSMIWISEQENAAYNELVLLNLWIVQEGLSYVKGTDKFPEFTDVFVAAESQAKDQKLNLFSGEKEPGFNDGDYQTTSLLELKNEVIRTLKNPEEENKFNNVRVRVRGTVAGFTNNILFLQSPFENEETGAIEYAGINIFCGMTPPPSKFTTVNTFIEISALALDNENFGFQLTDVYNFPRLSSSNDPNDTKVLYTAEEIPDEYKVTTFNKSINDLGSYYEGLFSPVTITEEVEVLDGYPSDDKKEVTLYLGKKGESKPNLYIPFLYQPYPDTKPLEKWNDPENFIGHTFKVTGIYSFHKKQDGTVNFQIIPRTSEDVVLVK